MIGEVVQVKPSVRIIILCLSWMVMSEALVGCHDILISGKSPIKWRQRPDMTIAVDWDVKHLFKQKVYERQINHNKLFKHLKSIGKLSKP